MVYNSCNNQIKHCNYVTGDQSLKTKGVNLRNNDEHLSYPKLIKTKTKRLLRKREKLSDIITVFKYVRFWEDNTSFTNNFSFQKILK